MDNKTIKENSFALGSTTELGLPMHSARHAVVAFIM